MTNSRVGPRGVWKHKSGLHKEPQQQQLFEPSCTRRMGKVPVRLKEVVYTISPFETTVLTGVFKDVPGKLHKYWKEVSWCWWRSAGPWLWRL